MENKEKQVWSLILLITLLLYIPFQATAGVVYKDFTIRAPTTIVPFEGCYSGIVGPPMQHLQEIRVYRVTFRTNDTTLVTVVPAVGMAGLDVNFSVPCSTGTMGVIIPVAKNNMGDGCIGPQYVFAIPMDAIPEPPDPIAGLQADYFNNLDFTAFALSRVDPQINFDWTSVNPDPLIQQYTFSVLWRGFVTVPVTDVYTFYADVNDGVRLWIDNNQLIDSWTNSGRSERFGQITLSAGTYPLTMEYFQEFAGAVAILKWENGSGSISKQVIPASALSH